MARIYVPDAGDIVWLSFNPQTGRGQAGHRPAVVLSPAAYNEKTSLMLCCPMTSQIKNYPFEVQISGASPSVRGIIAFRQTSAETRFLARGEAKTRAPAMAGSAICKGFRQNRSGNWHA